MKTVEEAAKEFSNTNGNQSCKLMREIEYDTGKFVGFKAGVKFSQSWIPVDEEIECNIDIDGIMYSENVLLKVNDFEFPLVGCYMRANDDEFWEIYGKFEIYQKDITHYRFIELK